MQFDHVGIGEVYVHKTTGAYAVVIQKLAEKGSVLARMCEELGTSSKYVAYEFIPEELESVEAHLRRNLQEMEFKQDLIESAKKRRSQKELEEAVTPSLVN